MVPSSDSNLLPAMAPLSDEEVDELDQFLLSDATSDETMVLDVLDGYVTAIARLDRDRPLKNNNGFK